MNIKDIATAAQVSITTVSKVVNQHDQDISEETRQRVLKVIREYQYVPHSRIKNRSLVQSLHCVALIILNDSYYVPEFLYAMEQYLAQNGYSLLLCSAIDSTAEELEKRIKIVLAKRVEGIILCTHTPTALQFAQSLLNGEIPLVAMTSFRSTSCSTVRCDYAAAAKDAVSLLAAHGHQRIGFVLDHMPATVFEQVYGGIVAGLNENARMQCIHNIVTCDIGNRLSETEIQNLLNRDPTAIYCQTPDCAVQIYEYLLRNNIAVPQDISLLCGLRLPLPMAEQITSYGIPYEHLVEQAVNLLFRAIVDREQASIQDQCVSLLPKRGMSIAAPRGSEAPILVLGNCASDTILSVPRLPQNSQLVTSTNVITLSGGKCVLQAIAAARLGGCVYAMGKIGNDPEGHSISNTLLDNNVRIDGIQVDCTVTTGHSYLISARNGEFAITSYPGANQFVDVQSVKKVQNLLPSAFACLISTEVPLKVIRHLIQKCIPCGTRIFLKPSGTGPLDMAILEHIDYLVPNEAELYQLLPGPGSLEEKAARLYQLGCRNIIVTLEDQGFYIKNRTYDVFLPAPKFQTVDTTGAANCFLAALAVSLSEREDLLYALAYGAYAAGLSISQAGTFASFPYKRQMDLYLEDIHFYHQAILQQVL